MTIQLIILILSQFAFAQQYAPGSVAILDTNKGEIRIHLRKDIAPATVNNFVGLATGKKEFRDADTGKTIRDTPFYQKHVFHRVHPSLGIHTGCPWGTGHGWPGFYIPFEKQGEKIKFDRPYLVGLATIPNRPDTGGSQFFITTKPGPELNQKHVLFGEVFLGKDVVDKIANTKRDSMMRPLKPVKLNSIWPISILTENC